MTGYTPKINDILRCRSTNRDDNEITVGKSYRVTKVEYGEFYFSSNKGRTMKYNSCCVSIGFDLIYMFKTEFETIDHLSEEEQFEIKLSV